MLKEDSYITVKIIGNFIRQLSLLLLAFIFLLPLKVGFADDKVASQFDNFRIEKLFQQNQSYRIICTTVYPSGKKHSCRYYSGGKGTKDTVPYGIDIGVPVGTKIYAPAAGVVQEICFDERGFGFHFEILHDDGTVTLYAHLQYYGYVFEGMRVKQGQLIATTGNSGNSTGPHLHFEISNRNPAEF